MSDTELFEFPEIKNAQGAISMKVDGHPVREVPGPQGLPGVGNYFESKSVIDTCVGF